MAIQICMQCGDEVYDDPLLDDDEGTYCDSCIESALDGIGTLDLDEI